LVPGWVVSVGLGLSFLEENPIKRHFVGAWSWRRVRQGFVIGLLSLFFLTQLLQINQLRFANDPRYPSYRAVGEWLQQNTPLNAKVGALEIGIIGFFAQRPMIDFAGLIQPEVAVQMQADTTYDDTAVWATLSYQPEFLVLIAGAHPNLEAQVVAEFCHLIRRFSNLESGFADLHIYACRYD
jgi:hypothetical protein